MITRFQTFSVNANNDLYLNNEGNMVLEFELQAILQACAQVAKTLLGELVLATDVGIPYLNAVFVGVPNLIAFQAALRTAWLNLVPGVIGVSNLITNQTTISVISYSATIETIIGSGLLESGDIFNG
jgi:hypothetical protein